MKRITSTLIFGVAVMIVAGCSPKEPITSRARRSVDLLLSKKVTELTPEERQIHWTLFDTLALVAEEVHPDTAFAIYCEFFAKKSEKSRMSTALAVKQLNALNEIALKSCQPNAIYIPNGDNDYYPVLYLQKVEKCREDVLILHQSLGLLKDFRAFYAEDPRIEALFSEDEWLAGPSDSIDPIQWVGKKCLEKGEEAPALNFALICHLHLNLPPGSYYQEGLVSVLGQQPDSLEWAKRNVELLLPLADSPFAEKWEPEIDKSSWCSVNAFNMVLSTIMAFENEDAGEEAGDFYKKMTPVFSEQPNWWLFGHHLLEEEAIDTAFFVGGARAYLESVPDSMRSVGWNNMLKEIVMEFDGI